MTNGIRVSEKHGLNPSANVVLVGKKVYKEIIDNNDAPGGGKEAAPQ